jgi:hypothetical protein
VIAGSDTAVVERVCETCRPFVEFRECEPALAAHEREMIGHRIGDAFEQVRDVELHRAAKLLPRCRVPHFAPRANICRTRRGGRTMVCMKKGTTGEAHVHIEAPPDAVYSLVSDVTRMGEWSPETIKCEWLDGATGPAVGARFKGTNKRGIARWSTKPKVEPEGSGTKLSESFEMLRDIRWYYALAERWLMRVKDRQTDLVEGMRTTLERIKNLVEAQP